MEGKDVYSISFQVGVKTLVFNATYTPYLSLIFICHLILIHYKHAEVIQEFK